MWRRGEASSSYIVLGIAGYFFAPRGAAAAEEIQAVRPDAFAALEKLLKDQKFDDALVAANAATRNDPNSAQAFFLLGAPSFIGCRTKPRAPHLIERLRGCRPLPRRCSFAA